MKRNEEKFTIIILLLLVGVAALIGGCLLRLADIKAMLQAQFEYQTGMQMCTQDAMKYLAPCYLERDEDGSYNWYLNPEEGRL